MSRENTEIKPFHINTALHLHNSVQGSSALKYLHCPVHDFNGLHPQLIDSHKAIAASGMSVHCGTYLQSSSFRPILQEMVIVVG